MRLLVTGGTGFIGRAACRTLDADGHTLVVLTRAPSASTSARVRFVAWKPPALSGHRPGGPPEPGAWEEELASAEGVINLAGESLVAKRWTTEQKTRLVDSRVGVTRALVEAMRRARQRPKIFIQASALGYYGSRGEEALHEAAPPGSDFLAHLCRQWEDAARAAEPLGVRVVRLRFGMVLARDGGALAHMLPPFRLGLGGPLGSGRQWVSWIHRDDLIAMMRWALHEAPRPPVGGAVNATAPNPVTMREFANTLGRALHRPAVLPVPGLALRVLLGDVAEMLLTGQRVVPSAALQAGFRFSYPTLSEALAAILQGG